MHVVVQFLRNLRDAAQAAPRHRSSDVTVNDLTDLELVETVLKEAEAALEVDPVILAVVGKAVITNHNPGDYLRCRRRAPWGDEVFEAASCDASGFVARDEWKLYRCGDMLPREWWRIGAGPGDVYFVEPLAPAIPPVVG